MFFSSWLIVPKSPELARLAQLLEGGVGAVDVGLVVLAVVQLEDLGREVRLERGVVVGQFGQFVLAAWVLLGPCDAATAELRPDEATCC